MRKPEYTDANKVVADGSFTGTLNFKPYGSYILMVLIGVALIMMRFRTAVIVGVCMLAFAAVTFFMVKDRKVIDFYSDAALLYDPNDETKAFKLEYKDIDYWTVDSANRAILFVLKDESTITVPTSRYVRAYNLLLKAAPDQRERSKIEKIREKNRKDKQDS